MGRGRAKAKQTKVARELKYSSPSTDLTALQRELSGGAGDDGRQQSPTPTPYDGDDRDEHDDYDDDRWASTR